MLKLYDVQEPVTEQGRIALNIVISNLMVAERLDNLIAILTPVAVEPEPTAIPKRKKPIKE